MVKLDRVQAFVDGPEVTQASRSVYQLFLSLAAWRIKGFHSSALPLLSILFFVPTRVLSWSRGEPPATPSLQFHTRMQQHLVKAQVVERYGEMPESAEGLSLWIVAVLPMPVQEKHSLLAGTSTTSRLLECERHLLSLGGNAPPAPPQRVPAAAVAEAYVRHITEGGEGSEEAVAAAAAAGPAGAAGGGDGGAAAGAAPGDGVEAGGADGSGGGGVSEGGEGTATQEEGTGAGAGARGDDNQPEPMSVEGSAGRQDEPSR